MGLRELRDAVRTMKRAPGFTAAAIATLALGLGLNSTVLSLAYTIFLRPLPVGAPSELVFVDQTLATRPDQLGFSLSYPDYVYYRDHARAFSDLAAHYPTSPMQVVTRDGAFGVSGAVVTANYFSLLGLRPALGRFFSTDEDQVPGRNPVAVLGYDLWRARFGRDPGIVGGNVRINGTPFTVIGITPEGFRGIVRGTLPNDVWIPTAMFSVGYRYCDGFARDCRIVNLIGRLHPRTSIDDAQIEMTVLSRQLEAAFPGTNTGRGVVVRPARGIRPQEQARDRPIVSLLAGAASLVLLVASANVAGLLLSRGLGRRKEIAIRLALGASRRRVIRQVLAESIVLGIGGGLAGLLVAAWSADALRAFFGVGYDGSAVNIDLSLDWRVVLTGLAVAVATGALTGIVPAFRATRHDPLPALKDEASTTTSRGSALRDGVIVVQLAVSVLFLASSGLLVRSFSILHRGPGFDPDAIVLLRLRPSLVGHDNERSWAFQREAMRRIEAMPGVTAASPGNVPPLPGWARPVMPMRLPGEPADPAPERRVATTNVGPRYFTALGGGVVSGREFDERDAPERPLVTIVNEALAGRLWPKGGAVGSALIVGNTLYEVVGVVKDLQFLSALDRPEPMAFFNYWQQDRSNNFSNDSFTLVRVAGSAAAMLPAIRQAIVDLDPEVPIGDLQPFGTRLDYAFSQVRAARTLLLTFGGLTLVLSAIGLYAALAFAIGQRTREIAIRIALGASRGEIARLVLRRGVAIVLLGVVAGLAASIATRPFIAHLLYGVGGYGPLPLLAGPSILAIVAFLAIWFPARRAMAMEPTTALRAE